MTMFRLEVIVFIAAIVAVNAAIINIYEDDVKTLKTKSHGVEYCNEAACNSLCRFLGFNKGTCDGDTCECSKISNQEQFQENTIPSLDEVKSEQIENNEVPSVDENEIGKGLTGCDPLACDQLCRRLQFPGGVCVNGRCKCDNFRPQSEQIERNEVPSVDGNEIGEGLTGCNPLACDQLCRRLQFPGGVCVNGRCKCDNFRPQSDAVIENTKDVRKCSNAICSQVCHALGYRYGVCINDNVCRCSNSLTVETVIENKIKDVSSCNNNGCNQICRGLGFRWGKCVGDVCRCSNAQSDDLKNFPDLVISEDLDNTVELNDYMSTMAAKPVRNCDQLACMMGCRELGFPGGTCFLNKCRCDNYRGNEDAVLRLLSLFQLQPQATCNPVTCNSMCFRLGYGGGSCRFGRCECF